jgi:3-oxoacyl-[acyl-carrier-protein] synthase I
MTGQLFLVGSGAVTPVCLDAPQTCAGIRAKVSRHEEVLRSLPLGKIQAVARIPAHWSLRRTPFDWLLNLAARAVMEVVERHEVNALETALILIPPEAFRQQSFRDVNALSALANSLCERKALKFHSVRQIPRGGAASISSALDSAVTCLRMDGVKRVILGAVDSYVLDADYARLDAAGRLRTEDTTQGLTPGEAAVFLLLSKEAPVEFSTPSVAILGWADAQESLDATSDSYSQGRGMIDALRSAATRAGLEESAIQWVISNANGERYASWESVLTHARFYRTRRERLPITYPAMSVGEVGSASGALALLVAAHGFFRGYGHGSTAMIELSSEGNGRAACLVAATEAAER